jgi:hypothetical protein
MRSQVKRCSNSARTFARSRVAILRTAATASATVSTTNPDTPSVMISGTEPRRKAIADVVSLTDELFRQIGDNALGAAVEFRWHAFVKRSDLGDLQLSTSRPKLHTECPRSLGTALLQDGPALRAILQAGETPPLRSPCHPYRLPRRAQAPSSSSAIRPPSPPW